MKAFDRHSDRKKVHIWTFHGLPKALRPLCRSVTYRMDFELSEQIDGHPTCKHCERIAKGTP